jgi:hypothetical protein
VHRATKESGLTESADGSIARRAQRAGALVHGLEPPRRPLTNTAFSWKFATCKQYSCSDTELFTAAMLRFLQAF